MKRSTYVIAIGVLTAMSAFGQAIIGMSSSAKEKNGIVSGWATFDVSPFLQPTLAGAPYSGEEVRESFQTLADGTHITRQMPPGEKTWRDSQGRVRTERSMMGGNPDRKGAPAFPEISDPIAGYVYVLDDVNRVAHRVKTGSDSQRAAAMARSAGAAGGGASVARANGPRPEVTNEDLGSKLIDGVLVFGTRQTRIIPEGAQGNDRPMTTTNEVWRSKELQLIVLSTNYSPVSGTVTTRIANLSTNDPDPALFTVPSDYTVVDEKDSFTINWAEK